MQIHIYISSHQPHQFHTHTHTGRLDYAVVDLDPQTKDMLDELKVENLRREELENKIREASERTKAQATMMMKLARENHSRAETAAAKVQSKLEDLEADKMELENELNDYVEVRDKCIQVKILNELLSNNNQALLNRINEVTDRCVLLRQSAVEADNATKLAREEAQKQGIEMNATLEYLENEAQKAREEADREIQQIEEKEREIQELRGKWSAETKRKIATLKAQALRAHASMVSSTEKQKLKILYLSKELSRKERDSRAMNMKKEKLLRDFSILRQAIQKHTDSDRKRFEDERNKIVVMHDKLSSRKSEFSGGTSQERLESLEKEMREEIEMQYRNHIKAIHVQKEQNRARQKEKGKLVFKQTSKHIGDMVTENMRSNIEAKTRARAELIKEREETESRLREMNLILKERQEFLEQRRLEVEQTLKQREMITQDKAKQLGEIRNNVKRLWKENDMSARVCLRFLKSVFAEIMKRM